MPEWRFGSLVFDPTRGAAYAMDPSHGIDAIDLNSGKLLWSTKNASKPLVLFSDQLIAQADASKGSPELKIVAPDLENGGQLRRKTVVALPRGITAWSVDEGQPTIFVMQVRRQKNLLFVQWSGDRRDDFRGDGAPVAPHGAVRIDLNIGRAEKLSDEEINRVEQAVYSSRSWPAAVPHEINSPSVAFPSASEPRSPSLVGDRMVALERVGQGEAAKTFLRVWSAQNGQLLATTEVELFSVIIRDSEDGQFLLVSRPGAPGPEGYVWDIFSLDSGRRVARINREIQAAPFIVLSDKVIYQSMEGFVAVDIASNQEVWRSQLGKPIYPPQPVVSSSEPAPGVSVPMKEGVIAEPQDSGSPSSDMLDELVRRQHEYDARQLTHPGAPVGMPQGRYTPQPLPVSPDVTPQQP
jgi:hypothetical protein